MKRTDERNGRNGRAAAKLTSEARSQNITRKVARLWLATDAVGVGDEDDADFPLIQRACCASCVDRMVLCWVGIHTRHTHEKTASVYARALHILHRTLYTEMITRSYVPQCPMPPTPTPHGCTHTHKRSCVHKPAARSRLAQTAHRTGARARDARPSVRNAITSTRANERRRRSGSPCA